MTLRVLVALPLLLSASAPAIAGNWFANPQLGLYRNIGSAPNPTPEQVRQELRPPCCYDYPQRGASASAPARTAGSYRPNDYRYSNLTRTGANGQPVGTSRQY